MFGSIGMPELIIIFVIALIIFGPRKLPELGKSLGSSIREFKRASNEMQRTLEEEIKIEETSTPEPKKSETPMPAPTQVSDSTTGEPEPAPVTPPAAAEAASDPDPSKSDT